MFKYFRRLSFNVYCYYTHTYLETEAVVSREVYFCATLYIHIYEGLFQDVKLEELEFRAYALINFKTSSK